MEITARLPQQCAHLFSVVRQAGGRLRVADDRWLATAHDAGLFTAYAFSVRAQPLGMVEINAGDDGAVGVNHIDCV